jgi:hypothetical protein
MYKIFYFKSKTFDFHIKIFFLEIKLYLGSFFKIICSFFTPYNYTSLFKLNKKNSEENILIIELNNIHSEIFPSWLFYLKKLSFRNNIFFLAPGPIHKSKPFDLISKKENNGYDFYKMDSRAILTCFKLGLFKNYKKVIFNSDIYYQYPLDKNYSHLSEFINKKDFLKNVVLSSHLILQTLSCKNKFITPKNQILTISPTISVDANIKYVAPLFNEDKEKIKSFNHKKIFTSCGNININEKDSCGLKIALQQTKKYDKIINIIGKAPKTITSAKDVIHYKKRLSYLELKSILQESYFILFLLNNSISYRYKFNSSSGSLPLALNFNLIPIIEKSFAKFYCLDSTNAIIYNEGSLNKAIEYACNMGYDEYIKLQSSLIKLKTKLKEKSLSNIDNLLNKDL